MRTALLLPLLLSTSLALAQAKLPLEFDRDPGFTAMPSFLSNATAKPEQTAADGTVTLRVSEAGKGMKFQLGVQPFEGGQAPYLVLRYRAAALAGGYALWVFDGSQGGLEALGTRELTQDGQWHEIAIDLAARGVSGSVRAFVTEVQCAQLPATISFDRLYLAEEPPAGATVLPKVAAQPKETVLKLADLPLPEAHEGWLANPAEKFGADKQEGALHLWSEGVDKGMKFSVALPQPVDLSEFAFVTIRYRAQGLALWGDYLVWLGSAQGGMPDQSTTLFSLANAHPNADGQWHVATVPLTKRFKAADLALQVSSVQTRGEVWIDSLRFSTARPLLDLADLLPYETGWGKSRLPKGSFRTLDLSAQANASVAARLRGLGLKSWLPAGKLTARGIPFERFAGPKDALITPIGLEETAAVSIGAKASELYLLMLSRLPSVDGCRMGDPVAMDAFSTPERFRFRVNYADGVSVEQFPIACGSGQFQVSRGPEVYCLTGLRDQPVKSVALVNRMESALFLLAGVTLNEGKAVTAGPEVAGMPTLQYNSQAYTPVQQIRQIPGGYLIQGGVTRLDLQTAGGIIVRSLSSNLKNKAKWQIEPGPLFELGDGTMLLDSAHLTVGEPVLTGRPVDPKTKAPVGGIYTLSVPVSGAGMSGNLVISVGNNSGSRPAFEDLFNDIRMSLDLTNTSGKAMTPVVNFPILRKVRFGSVADTWYLMTRKGGLISNRETHQRHAYGGQHPLQVDDIFNPTACEGLAIVTQDLRDLYRHYDLTKDKDGVTYRIEYWPREYQAGETIDTAPTLLRGHMGYWWHALDQYRMWVRTWYKPQAPRKPWFQNVFYYQQSCAWGGLRDQASGKWKMDEFIKRCKDNLGCLDYLHIFDFGESRVYGRVGDYNHYDELGGLPAMRAAVKKAQDQGVRMGLYIEGYLCDERGVWGKENCSKFDVRKQDGKPLLWAGDSTEHMMCPASDGWRNHLAETYKRVAGELKPDGMYIDQYGFTDTWKTCWSREHGHPVPMAPLQGEGETLQAIRQALPDGVANLTEETPNDVHAQYQDGALGYSVTFSDPALMPHRVDLFRFMFPDFKVLQLTSYNNFTEGGWDLLKFPFFNGEGWWLGGDPASAYCPDAKAFLTKAFAILHRYSAAFTASEVYPLIPTLKPTVFANEFRGPKGTVWTIFNGEYRTFSGDLLKRSHQEGTVYRDAFSGREIKARIEKHPGFSEVVLPVTVGPRDVGCIVAERR